MTAKYTDRFPYYHNKIAAYDIPDAYPGTPPNTITTEALPAGTYEIGFAFEADFTGSKDKPLAFQLTGDYAGAEFSESSSSADVNNKKSRYYMFPKDVAEGTVVTHGIHFMDQSGGNNITVDFCDVIIRRVK